MFPNQLRIKHFDTIFLVEVIENWWRVGLFQQWIPLRIMLKPSSYTFKRIDKNLSIKITLQNVILLKSLS